MAEVIKSWKGFTAYRCNQILGRAESQFWADEYWDTYMRDAEHESRTVRYIENNPTKAGFVRAAKDWPWSSARFRGEDGLLRIPS